MQSRISALAAMAIFIPILSLAQRNGTEPRQVAFPVEEISCHDGQCEIWFSLRELGSLPKGAKVSVQSTYTEEGGPPKELLVLTNPDVSYDEVILTVPEAQGSTLPQQCMAVVTMDAHRLGHRGVLTALADNGILLTDVEGSAFYDLFDLMQQDSPGYEDEMVLQMVDDIHRTADAMRGQMDPVMLKGGIFDGMEVLDAMEKTQHRHLRMFLSYLVMKPGIYMGRRWKVSEVYATWLAAESPQPALNQAERLRLLQESGALTTGVLRMDDLQADAQREVIKVVGAECVKAHDLQSDDVQHWLVVLKRLAAEAIPAEVRADASLERGRLLVLTGDVKGAMADLDNAQEMHKALGRLHEQIVGQVLMAKCHLAERNAKAALKAVNRGHALHDNWSGLSWNSEMDMLAGELWDAEARALWLRRDAEEAEQRAWNAIDVLEPMETAQALFAASQTYKLLAEIAESKGEEDAAREYRTTADQVFWRAAGKLKVFEQKP